LITRALFVRLEANRTERAGVLVGKVDVAALQPQPQ
jgi:hypothetical protein